MWGPPFDDRVERALTPGIVSLEKGKVSLDSETENDDWILAERQLVSFNKTDEEIQDNEMYPN